jgi:hypothetical protein
MAEKTQFLEAETPLDFVALAEHWSMNDDPQLDQAMINFRSVDPDGVMANVLLWCDENTYRVVRYQCDIDQHWGQVVVARHDFPRPPKNAEAVARVQEIADQIGGLLDADDAKGWVRVKNPYATARRRVKDGELVSLD